MILSWNCQGADSFLTVRRLRKFDKKIFPGILFLMETKRDQLFLQDLQANLGYDFLFTVDPCGLSGGLALMAMAEFQVQFLFSNKNFIDVTTTIHSNKVVISFVYREPVILNRHLIWERLTRISTTRFGPWLMTRDFNEITGHHEKTGGRVRPEKSFLDFRLMRQSCGMVDFPHTV